jgi:Ca-activated chloride channel homolog
VEELGSVYDELGSRVGSRRERRQITAAFVGAAALLLAGGGLMSLRWFGRLP